MFNDECFRKNKEKYIGSLVILVISIVFLIVGYNLSKPNYNNEDEKNCENMFVESKTIEKSNFKLESSSDTIVVDIKGAVNKPGVYNLKKDGRVKDLIEIASGFTKDADINRMHMSKKLKDEDLIYVYKIGEKENLDLNRTLEVSRNTSSYNNDSDGKKVNLNTASIEELKTLPGVGDVTANKIIEFREKNGGFKSLEDLLKIDRIGEKTLKKFRDKVEI
ncbi:helix-hairpin-helix domain-containing protein [Haloimpatiens sp. FM7315]|uniref:helix-hairpin-helix domain-containing protein n=1 Tax=Haloimpatiens sp. FM7315 TaxID=3298609 RepID=UPI0035A3C64F